jgi:hypothetical protein
VLNIAKCDIFLEMNPTAEVLRAEAARYKSLAARMESLAGELEGMPSHSLPEEKFPPVAVKLGEEWRKMEFSALSQGDAILEALRRYGPHTPRQLFDRLGAGGKPFKGQSHVYGILHRIKDKIEKTEDKKWRLKEVSQ